MALRNALYQLARFLGDMRAIRTGRIVPRIERRILGRIAGRTIASIMRRLK